MSPEDRAEIDLFRRYLRREMSPNERHAYENTERSGDTKQMLRTLDICAGKGTMAEARDAAGLSVGQAAKLLAVSASDLRRIEAGESRPTPALRVMMLATYDVVGFVDAPGTSEAPQ